MLSLVPVLYIWSREMFIGKVYKMNLQYMKEKISIAASFAFTKNCCDFLKGHWIIFLKFLFDWISFITFILIAYLQTQKETFKILSESEEIIIFC